MSSEAVATLEEHQPAPLVKSELRAVGPFEPATLTEALGLARMLSKSDLIPDALKDKPGDVLVVLMSGREYGVSPLRALQNFHVVKGKVGMSAQIIVGMCLSHAKCKYSQVLPAHRM